MRPLCNSATAGGAPPSLVKALPDKGLQAMACQADLILLNKSSHAMRGKAAVWVQRMRP